MSEKVIFDTAKILDIIPHRYPFLLVDKIVELEPDVRIVGIKNVTMNEPFFQGHFPGRPVMPGVLIIEALAQVGAILAKVSPSGVGPDKLLYLAGATDFRWKQPVVPGDVLKLEMTTIRHKGPIFVMAARATVDGVLVTEGQITAAAIQ